MTNHSKTTGQSSTMGQGSSGAGDKNRDFKSGKDFQQGQQDGQSISEGQSGEGQTSEMQDKKEGLEVEGVGTNTQHGGESTSDIQQQQQE